MQYHTRYSVAPLYTSTIMQAPNTPAIAKIKRPAQVFYSRAAVTSSAKTEVKTPPKELIEKKIGIPIPRLAWYRGPPVGLSFAVWFDWGKPAFAVRTVSCLWREGINFDKIYYFLLPRLKKAGTWLLNNL
jgi:hypothetical protein